MRLHVESAVSELRRTPPSGIDCRWFGVGVDLDGLSGVCADGLQCSASGEDCPLDAAVVGRLHVAAHRNAKHPCGAKIHDASSAVGGKGDHAAVGGLSEADDVLIGIGLGQDGVSERPGTHKYALVKVSFPSGMHLHLGVAIEPIQLAAAFGLAIAARARVKS